MSDQSEPGSRTPKVSKLSDASQPGRPEPVAMESESARLLENESAERLEGVGVAREELARLADRYVALGLGQDVGAFVSWVQAHRDPADPGS